MKVNRHGELTIDHRASPGFTPEFREAMLKAGVLIPNAPEGSVLELKTKQCAHCGGCVVLNPERVRARGHCFRCDKYLCDACAAAGECRPIMALADALLGSDKPVSQHLNLPLICK